MQEDAMRWFLVLLMVAGVGCGGAGLSNDAVAWSSDALWFQPSEPGQSSSAVLEIVTTSDTPAWVGEPEFSADNPNFWTVARPTQWASDVEPGGVLEVVVKFSPGDWDGGRTNGSLTLQSDGGPIVVRLVGCGASADCGL
jgi:hypothetical protein